MKHVKKLALSLTLMSALSVAAFAGETESPPCAPGETHGPPCAQQSVSEQPTLPGETSSPPASDTGDWSSLVETVLWSLSLF